MQGLRTLGLVEIRPRLGARVLDVSAESALASSALAVLLRDQTVAELYDVRLIIEPAAAAKAAVHRTEADLAAIKRAMTHYRVAYETGASVWEADIELHDAIAAASGNSVLPRILAPVADLLLRARQATETIHEAIELALHQHQEIADAIADGDAERSQAAMTQHIQSAIWALTQLPDASPAGPEAVQAQS